MRYALVTGMGRSGTKFLGSLLKFDPNIYSTHEYIGNREFNIISWYLGRVYSDIYLKQEKQIIEDTIDKELFIDVNGHISDCTESLKTVFDNPSIFHLVRNPKKVVPSLMIRRDDRNVHKVPKTESEIEAWIKMSKLEQVCVNWVQTTENLLTKNTELLLFEEITTDYNYISKKLLQPLRINISKEKYEEFKSKKVNRTPSFFYRYLKLSKKESW